MRDRVSRIVCRGVPESLVKIWGDGGLAPNSVRLIIVSSKFELAIILWYNIPMNIRVMFIRLDDT